jgi:shikimate kinase
MIGTGRAWGAVTIVNALATGVGSAAAISLPVEVEVELSDRGGPAPRLSIPPESDTAVVRGTVVEALRFFSMGEGDVRVAVRSSIPMARGLKSSSAVSVALLRAIASAVGRDLEPSDAARMAARFAREQGLSATGAFDDALAGAAGGIVVTRNGPDQVLRAETVDPTWRVVLWVPEGAHVPSPEWLDAFRTRSGEGRAAAERAQAGDYPGAMQRNTELVEQVVGYDYRAIRARLAERGALASGVSGMGPTLAAIAPADRLGSVARALPRDSGRVVAVDFVGRADAEPTGEGQ